LQNATTVELAKQVGTEYRSVRLSIGSNGAIRMDAHDMGPTIERVWDHEDYEFSVGCLHRQWGDLRSSSCGTSLQETSRPWTISASFARNAVFFTSSILGHKALHRRCRIFVEIVRDHGSDV
jgi:hypothetical protein